MRLFYTAILGMTLTGAALAAPRIGKPVEGSQPGQQQNLGNQNQQNQGMGQEAVPREVQIATGQLSQLADHMQNVAKLAEKQASNQEIRTLAQEISQEYAVLGQDLESWSKQNDVRLGGIPQETYRQQVSNLRGLKGKAFDRAFLQIVRDENESAVQDIESLQQSVKHEGFDTEMKQILPVLRRYSDEAGKFQKQLGTRPQRM